MSFPKPTKPIPRLFCSKHDLVAYQLGGKWVVRTLRFSSNPKTLLTEWKHQPNMPTLCPICHQRFSFSKDFNGDGKLNPSMFYDDTNYMGG